MKANKILLIFFSSLIYFSISSTISPKSNWKLDVKNENMTNETIIVKPNQYTKVILVVSHEDDLDILDYSFDRSKFTIELEDNDHLHLYGEKMIITPSASLEYIAYIGLECEYDISKNSKIKFKVTSIKDLDDKDLDDATLNTEE